MRVKGPLIAIDQGICLLGNEQARLSPASHIPFLRSYLEVPKTAWEYYNKGKQPAISWYSV